MEINSKEEQSLPLPPTKKTQAQNPRKFFPPSKRGCQNTVVVVVHLNEALPTINSKQTVS